MKEKKEVTTKQQPKNLKKPEPKEPKTTETLEIDLSRQSRLVPQDKINNYDLKIYGVGSIGSHVARILVKTGFKNIEVIDCDKVESENIAAQAYDFAHIGMNKVDAMAKICKDAAGVDIITTHTKIDKKTNITPEANTFYLCFFDSFEARQLIFDKVKEYPVFFIDGRIGRYDKRYYFVNCANEKEVESYDKTLSVKGGSDLICGEKASAPINAQIAGQIVMNLVSVISEKQYITRHIGNSEMPTNDINVVSELRKIEEDVEEEEELPDGVMPVDVEIPVAAIDPVILEDLFQAENEEDIHEVEETPESDDTSPRMSETTTT